MDKPVYFLRQDYRGSMSWQIPDLLQLGRLTSPGQKAVSEWRCVFRLQPPRGRRPQRAAPRPEPAPRPPPAGLGAPPPPCSPSPPPQARPGAAGRSGTDANARPARAPRADGRPRSRPRAAPPPRARPLRRSAAPPAPRGGPRPPEARSEHGAAGCARRRARTTLPGGPRGPRAGFRGSGRRGVSGRPARRLR